MENDPCLLAVLHFFASQSLANFSVFLTAIAAWVGIIFAVFKLPRELERWQDRERQKQEAQVAGKVLTALVRLVDAVEYIMNPFSQKKATTGTQQNQTSRSSELRQLISERINNAHTDIQGFNAAWSEAQVYLDGSVNSKLESSG